MKILALFLATTLAWVIASPALAATSVSSVGTIPMAMKWQEPRDYFDDLRKGHASPRPAEPAPAPSPALQTTLQVYLLMIATGLLVNRLPSPQQWPQTELAAADRSRTRWTIARSPFDR